MARERDARALSIEKTQLDEIRKDLNGRVPRIVEGATFETSAPALAGRIAEGGAGLKKGQEITTKSWTVLSMVSGSNW